MEQIILRINKVEYAGEIKHFLEKNCKEIEAEIEMNSDGNVWLFIRTKVEL